VRASGLAEPQVIAEERYGSADRYSDKDDYLGLGAWPGALGFHICYTVRVRLCITLRRRDYLLVSLDSRRDASAATRSVPQAETNPGAGTT
jgi:hypothetical protein